MSIEHRVEEAVVFVGQIARYLGYVRIHMAAAGQALEGPIIAHESDDQLRYAVAAMPGLQLATYEVNFTLQPAPTPKADSHAA